ncbi:MAG TPA: hypothetical protein VIO86_00820 [Candidatus Dormibacteraeota bacterium]
MHGLQTSDLTNALMADRHRYAAQVARERSARRSSAPRPRDGRSGWSVIALLGAAAAGARAVLVRPRPSTSIY